jgi:branched-chain amino acid transport system permease protein
MRPKGTGDILLLAGLLAILATLPLFISQYQLSLATTMVIYSLFALSYNMLFGYAGLLSFGHAAYFGVGAYAMIIFINRGLGLIPSLVIAGVWGALAGLVFGVFVVRLGGTYFALLTLAFNQLIYAGAEKWRGLTGGENGLTAMRPDLHLAGLAKIDMSSMVNWYYLVLVVVVLSAAFCWYFNKTPLGRLNECLRENEDRARFIGYNTFASKVAIYIISAFFAGLAGGLAAASQQFVTTSFINLSKAEEVLIMTFIGGSRNFWGPILGVCFMTYMNDSLSSLTEHWILIQGIIFILLVMYAPDGLSGLLVQLKDRLLSLIRNKTSRIQAGGH